MIRRGVVVLAAAGATLLTLAGCGSGGSPTPAQPLSNGLPPRPATLRITGIDPCTLLTMAQHQQLGVNAGVRTDYERTMPLQGTACQWGTEKAHGRIGYGGSLVTNRGAEYSLGAEPLRTIGGYAATTTASGLSEPRWYCAMLVDVAPGQSLLVDYSVESQDIPDMTHLKACDNAQTAAELMLANLRAAQPTG